MDELNSITNTDRVIDEIELETIATRLSANMKNKFFFNQEPYKAHDSVRIIENYEGKNLRQSYFKSCLFDGANLKKTGLAGSVFFDCSFKPCLFIDTNLQSCDFRSCRFESVELEYTRMNKSSFYDTVFKDCVFNSVSMNDAIFEKCQFINCTWTLSIENTIFKDTLLDTVIFKEMNFEFATFENIKSNNVKFPFPTIPFIYNGLTYISTTSDDIRITSAQKKDGLTANEYLNYIKDLKDFYTATQNYFPLVNILISQKEYKKAFDALVLGLKLSIQIRAFRMLKYYCKQLKYINNVSIHQRQNLYFFILNEISRCDLQEFEKNALNLYLPEVKDLLYYQGQNKRLQILLDTNIKENDFDKISILMFSLDRFLKNKCTYSLELRHNSPFQGLLDILTDAEKIDIILKGLTIISSVTFGTIHAIQNLKARLSKADETICNEACNELEKSGINIANMYVINNGNIYINTQDSSQESIYLNK